MVLARCSIISSVCNASPHWRWQHLAALSLQWAGCLVCVRFATLYDTHIDMCGPCTASDTVNTHIVLAYATLKDSVIYPKILDQ